MPCSPRRSGGSGKTRASSRRALPLMEMGFWETSPPAKCARDDEAMRRDAAAARSGAR